MAYDKTSGKVYLFANGSDPVNQQMKVFDVTDLSNPIAVMASDLQGASYEGVRRVDTSDYNIAAECYCLSNGALLVPVDSEQTRDWGTYMVYPTQGAIDVLARRFDSANSSGNIDIVVGNMVFSMDGLYDTMTAAPIQSMGSGKEVSVQGGIPNHQHLCAGPDRVYFWTKNEGLYYIDQEGWQHCAVEADIIECQDFQALPDNIWDMRVNQKGTCVLYDNSTKSIRILEKLN